jgi:hypothetical protein
MHAVNCRLGLGLASARLAALCQVVENKVVGAPCGIMDQVTSACGESGKLLALRCQPCDLLGQHELPPGIRDPRPSSWFALRIRIVADRPAQVDGAPIYQREVDSMVDDMLSQGIIAEKPELAKTALTTLINEKLMDEQLADYKVNVVPEAFWRLRLALPGRITSIVIAAKRQALKDVLYSDWLFRAKQTAKIEIKEARGKPGAAGPTGSAAPTGQPIR